MAVRFIKPFTQSLIIVLALAGVTSAAAQGNPTEQPSEAGSRAIAAGVWASADGRKVTYEASYFEPYQSVTAADMLRWVPGGAELIPSGPSGSSTEKRGFGSGGDQVLINGKRISGKSNDIGSALARIQATVVTRVEVIRGTTPGLDVRSEGTLVNIVLDGEVSGGAGSWQLHSGFYGEDPEYDGLFSYSNSSGRLNYLVSAQLGPYNRGNKIERYEEYRAAGGSTVTERRETRTYDINEELILNGSTNWSFDGGSLLNINARVADRERDIQEITESFVIGGDGTVTQPDLTRETGLDWELGGDLEQPLGIGILKTRLIYTRKDELESERVSLTSTDPGNVPEQSLIDTDSLATETIVRSSYSWTLANGQNLELGAEGAQNTLNKDVSLFAVEADGALTPVQLFNADSDVNEDRFEFFSTHFWQLRDSIALESALNVEYSKIAQEGLDVENSRTFTYVKPRFDLRWDVDGTNQFRASAERTVSQLDFADFVANFDGDNDQVVAGNPDLEPEKAWEYKFAYERRLADDNGVFEAQLFYNAIEDHIDNIRVTDTSSAAGNIGDAELYGLTLKGSLRLAGIGLEGAVVDVNLTVQDSETTDPFTGQPRKMSDKRRSEYGLNFRHDIAQWKLSYNVEASWNGKRYQNDINYRESTTSVNPNTNFNIQYRLTDRMVLWFDTRLVFDGHSRRYRDRYTGNVADGNLLRHEVRDQYYRREFILGMRGQF